MLRITEDHHTLPLCRARSARADDAIHVYHRDIAEAPACLLQPLVNLIRMFIRVWSIAGTPKTKPIGTAGMFGEAVGAIEG